MMKDKQTMHESVVRTAQKEKGYIIGLSSIKNRL